MSGWQLTDATGAPVSLPHRVDTPDGPATVVEVHEPDETWSVGRLTVKYDRLPDTPHLVNPRLVHLRFMRTTPSIPSPHRYTSTACQHGEHGQCRRVCKFCPAECECPCHGS